MSGIDSDGANGLDWVLIEDRFVGGSPSVRFPGPPPRPPQVQGGFPVFVVSRKGGDSAARGGRADIARTEPGDHPRLQPSSTSTDGSRRGSDGSFGGGRGSSQNGALYPRSRPGEA